MGSLRPTLIKGSKIFLISDISADIFYPSGIKTRRRIASVAHNLIRSWKSGILLLDNPANESRSFVSCQMRHSTWLLFHLFIILPELRGQKDEGEQRIVTWSSVSAGNVPLCPPRQYKMSKANKTFCDQSADSFPQIYTIIVKCVSSFTHEARAALCGAWTGSGDDPWPKVYEHAASWRFRHSYMRRRLYNLIYRCTLSPRWTPHVNQLSLCLLESSVWWENVTWPHSHTK